MTPAPSTATEAPLGATPQDSGVLFRCWAPKVQKLDLVLEPDGDQIPMTRLSGGYFEASVPDLEEGALYRYRLDDGPIFPDPYSRFQPEGVHGPSMVTDGARFQWDDGDWEGIAHRDLVFYELHVGTFSPEGTYEGARNRLEHLKSLGVTAIELMPLADWPGRWNWGYDHASLFAPSRAYGTPDDLREFIDAAHGMGMAVFHDVIFNHLGPDGAYVTAFAPLFTEKHHTPWGPGINLDDADSRGVRRLLIDNALYWLRDFHFDGLRLDATDWLQDESPKHFLQELAEAVAALRNGPPRYLIAEDHRNLNTVVLPREQGGYGLHAVWADNFHHLLRNMTAGDEEGYYADFAGSSMADVAVTVNQGWFYDHERIAPSCGAPRGTSAALIQPENCVLCIQNHDQIGNRAQGNRISDDVPPAILRALSALLLFIPELPLIFQGQEWAAATPFQFFTDHNEDLGRLVTEGRRKEFKHFTSFLGEVPDPQDRHTFTRSKLDWQELEMKEHASVLRLYQDLLTLRPTLAADCHAEASGPHGLIVRRGSRALLLSVVSDYRIPAPEGARLTWHTEQPEYAVESHPPELRDGYLHLHCAGAAILEAA